MTAINIATGVSPAKTKIDSTDPLAAAKLGWDLSSRMHNAGSTAGQNKILLCVGTDRSTGDSLGPLVGSKLATADQDFFRVFGTLEHPVHAGNLRDKVDEIYRHFDDPYIIAVDACLGSLDSVGKISVGHGALLPGAGVNKNLPAVGDLHITGIVNVGGFLEFVVLQNTRLNVVMKIADLIAEGLMNVAAQNTIRKAHSF